MLYEGPKTVDEYTRACYFSMYSYKKEVSV